MKKLLLASVALVGLAGGALAADLPMRRAAPVFTPVPVFTWTGFYVGVNAGYGWQDRRRDTVDIPAGSIAGSLGTAGTITFDDRDDEGGFVGGGQVGFNWQTGMFVWGIEADLQYADLARNGTTGYTFAGVTGAAFAPPSADVLRRGAGIDWFGTVRGRLGIAMDRTLVYATGGFAYGGNDDNCRGFSGFDCGDDDVRGGYTVGGGLEYAFTNNITAKIEGLYVNLDRDGRRNGSVYDAATNTVFLDERRRDDDFAVVRAGLNFKFGTW